MSIDSPIDVNTKLLSDQGELLQDIRRYKRLMEKLTYLTVTKSDITFAVSVASQFLSTPRITHLHAVMRILRYLKKAPGRDLLYSNHGHTRIAGFSDADWVKCPFDMRSITEYCVFLRGNIIA